LIHVDRGHLNPNEINNHDPEAQDATFTLTNVAPQFSRFNELAWREYECLVREFIENYNENKTHFALTGTLGTYGWMNQDNPDQQLVKIPAFYWKAICFPDVAQPWSVVILGQNSNSNDVALSESIMTVDEFSTEYLKKYFGDETEIFDSVCQNSGLGPWAEIKQNWTQWKDKLGCNFAMKLSPTQNFDEKL